MPQTQVSWFCTCGCGKQFTRDIHFEYPPNEDNIFWTRFLKGIFVLILSILGFIFSIVLMNHEYKMKELEKVLADPYIRYEQTEYDCRNKDYRSDVRSIIREPVKKDEWHKGIRQ